jgi:hypothetical protein
VWLLPRLGHAKLWIAVGWRLGHAVTTPAEARRVRTGTRVARHLRHRRHTRVLQFAGSARRFARAEGDELRYASPVEALAAIREAGRTPLTLNEGISWLLQDPTVLQPGACFMTFGSRKHTAAGQVDGRCPAI